MGFADLINVTEGLGGIGEVNGKRTYQKGEDCFGKDGLHENMFDLNIVECVKELQRFIRREQNAEVKEVLVQLGSWNLVNKHLLPLLCTYRDDEKLSFEVCKLITKILKNSLFCFNINQANYSL